MGGERFPFSDLGPYGQYVTSAPSLGAAISREAARPNQSANGEGYIKAYCRKTTTLDEKNDVIWHIGFDDDELFYVFDGGLERRHALKFAGMLSTARNHYQPVPRQAKPCAVTKPLSDGYTVSCDDIVLLETLHLNQHNLAELLIELIDKAGDDTPTGVYATIRNALDHDQEQLEGIIGRSCRSRHG